MGDVEEVDTLAERLAWARGGELVSTLEELEALAAAFPGATGAAALPALMRVLGESEENGPEAAQQAVEVVARLLGDAANGALFLREVSNVVTLLDVLETCEAYTAVVILDLFAALHDGHGDGLASAVLAAPAGGARLLETLSDARGPVRNASCGVLEKLTRPQALSASVAADELRNCCAFSDVFAKLWLRLEEDDDRAEPAVARDCLRLVRNVITGPAMTLTLFADGAATSGLAKLPRYLEVPVSEAALRASGDEGDAPSLTPEEDKAGLDARKTALCALAVAARFAGADGGGDREDRQRASWTFEDLTLSLATLALTDDAGRVVDVDVTESDKATTPSIVGSAAWWLDVTEERHDATRADVRAGALSVLAAVLEGHEANSLAMCEARVPTDGRSPLVPRYVLEVATRPRRFGPAAAAATVLAKVMWATERAAIVAVMHAVAPPPSDDGDAEEVDESALGALGAALRSGDASRTGPALSLLRGLLGKHVTVRELALRVPGKEDGGDLFGECVRDHVMRGDAEGLALLGAWLDGCAAAGRKFLGDPDAVEAVAGLARPPKDQNADAARTAGLACLALGLCLDQLGDDQANGWTKATLLELVKRRVGLGAFSRERRVPFFFCFFSADEEAHI